MIELLIAFGAGLISFLSPCVLPLIPGYISFISGASLDELLANKKINLMPLILFTLGFSFVFIIFGAAASYLGQVLLQNSEMLRIIAGLIIIIFSLQLIGIININFLIAHITSFITLMPGDIVTTGTPPGVGLGMNPPVFLKDGDKMNLTVDNLGSQNIKVVAE